MKSNAAKMLYNYWNEIRGARIAPRRFEIEPTSIAGILPETFILQYTDPQSVDFRLSGTLVCDLFAREFRGQSIYSMWHDEDRELLQDGIVSIVDNGSVLLVEIDGVKKSGREISLEMIMMPLIHGNENITRIIGTISASAYDPNVVTRLDPITSLAIRESNQVWPDGKPHKILPKSVLANSLPPKIITAQNRRFRVFEGGLSQDPDTKRH